MTQHLHANGRHDGPASRTQDFNYGPQQPVVALVCDLSPVDAPRRPLNVFISCPINMQMFPVDTHTHARNDRPLFLGSAVASHFDCKVRDSPPFLADVRLMDELFFIPPRPIPPPAAGKIVTSKVQHRHQRATKPIGRGRALPSTRWQHWRRPTRSYRLAGGN